MFNGLLRWIIVSLAINLRNEHNGCFFNIGNVDMHDHKHVGILIVLARKRAEVT